MIDVAILVGGKGSRLNKITKKTPKPLIKIDKKKFLDHLLIKLARYKFKNIYLLCSYKKNLFYKFYNNKRIHKSIIKCIDEGKPKGTGGALYKIKNKISRKFIVLNGDTFFNINYQNLISTNLKNNYTCIAIIKTKSFKYNKKVTNLKISKSGALNFSKRKTNLMNGGIYLFNKKIFRFIKKGNLSLENDIFNQIINKKKAMGIIFKEKFIDIGTPKKLSFIKKNSNYLKNKAVFLDRDGVINKELGYILSYKKFKFLKGVKKAIKYINNKNYLVIVITNQAAVGKSLLNEKKLLNIHKKMEHSLWNFNRSHIDDIFYSPYYKNSNIKRFRKNKYDRKPNPGMIFKAIKKWNIDKNNSFFIGDKISDKLAASKVKIKFYYKKNVPLYDQIKKII